MNFVENIDMQSVSCLVICLMVGVLSVFVAGPLPSSTPSCAAVVVATLATVFLEVALLTTLFSVFCGHCLSESFGCLQTILSLGTKLVPEEEGSCIFEILVAEHLL